MAKGLQRRKGQDRQAKQWASHLEMGWWWQWQSWCPPRPLQQAACLCPSAGQWEGVRSSIHIPVSPLSPRALVCRWLLGNQWV